MFFMRLRRHARWMFVLLAVVFAFAFAFAGVGSGSTGIGDILNGQFGSIFGGGTPNAIKNAQKAVDKAEKAKNNAAIAAALHKLAIAQSAKDKNTDAVATYHRYLALRPNDARARKELSDVYGKDADTQQALLDPQQGGVLYDAISSLPNGPGSPSFDPSPIATSMHADAVDKATELYKLFSAAKAHQLAALEVAVARANPVDRRAILPSLATTAEGGLGQALNFARYASDSSEAATAQSDAQSWAVTALNAYKGLLAYHAHDQFTKQIKDQIKQLQGFTGISSG